MKSTATTLIDSAKQYTREAIHEAWPTAVEVAEQTAGMYEFDAICIDDESCPISSISIMHDPDAKTFTLVKNARPAISRKEEAALAPAFSFESPIDWDKLAEDHAIAYLRGDLATSSPGSYTIEEMKAISDGMFKSTVEVEEAMRKDFQSWMPQEQARMLDLLQQADSEHFGWWTDTLVGKMPESAMK